MKLKKYIKVGNYRLFTKMLFDHFNYSIKDIKSYDELTNEEKSFIDRDMFERITEN